jgi:biotin carboxyl carrier protein
LSVSDPITEIRALLMHFTRSGLKDMYLRSADLTVFMAQPGGADNPMQIAAEPVAEGAAAADPVYVTAPHIGLFAPICAVGDVVTAGLIIAMIDVLGRQTEVTSPASGRVTALPFGAGELVEFGEAVAEIEPD